MDAKEERLKGRKILIVDDDPDVLDTLEDLLSMCEVVKARTFEDASRKLGTQSFDMALLDIMGVNGYKLLELAVGKKVIAVMLTAHAFSPEDTMKSFKGGAAFYVPKDKMVELPALLADIFDAKEKGKSTWMPFMGWAEAYYSAKFGPKWEKHKKEFQEKLK
ncbi:MAG: response regulator [Desulfobacteraceae bacterium]|jgi:DNA-binding NtrC family response regulator|nr:MAG: response regulator [Desulfobacteraceae bacterium]